MGISWARCKICGKRFETSYDPRFDKYNPAGRMAERHVWNEHRDKLPEWLETFEQFLEWNAGRLKEPKRERSE